MLEMDPMSKLGESKNLVLLLLFCLPTSIFAVSVYAPNLSSVTFAFSVLLHVYISESIHARALVTPREVLLDVACSTDGW